MLIAPIVAFLAACGSPVTTSAPPMTTTEAPTATPPAQPAPPTPPPTPTASPATSFDPGGVALELEVLAGRLSEPVDVAVPPEDDGRWYVVEQAGRIRVVDEDGLRTRPFVDLRDRVSAGGERGLLGLAFHPDYPDDPRIFVDYTDLSDDTVVSEFLVADTDALVIDEGTERILLHIDQPYPNHNGGAVAFGPDGMLYVAMGDGGSGGDPHDHGRRLDSLLAKILRIDVDGPVTGDLPYGIPADNPYLGREGAAGETWHTGLRNPWRMRFDQATGDLWIGDVGQGAWEEIDLAPAGVGGLDFGWNIMEGTHCYEPAESCNREGLTLPVAEYDHGGGCAVIGGVVVRDPDQPLIDGAYLFSDSCSGNLWLLDAAAARNGPVEPALIESTGRSISAISLDADGSVVATDRRRGELVRITATAR